MWHMTNKANRNELSKHCIKMKPKMGKRIEMKCYKSFVVHFMRITHFMWTVLYINCYVYDHDAISA